MKSLFFLLIVIVNMLVFNACSDTEYEPIGKWHDNIKLSEKNVKLKAVKDSVIIRTKGSSWWITGISLNNESLVNPLDLNFDSDTVTYSKDGVVIERRDAKTLFIFMEANTEASKKIISISLQSGDYFDGVTITQAGKM